MLKQAEIEVSITNQITIVFRNFIEMSEFFQNLWRYELKNSLNLDSQILASEFELSTAGTVASEKFLKKKWKQKLSKIIFHLKFKQEFTK
jgi:hypothetical protein